MKEPNENKTEWPDNLPMYVRFATPHGESVLYKPVDREVVKDGMLFAEVFRRWRAFPAAESLATALTLYLTFCHNHGHNSDEAREQLTVLLDAAAEFEKAAK